MSLEKTKKLYRKLVKKGIINKDIQMKEVKKIFHKNLFMDSILESTSKYNAKKDLKKLYEKIK
tara:strand:- start:535 stop:723 length:189 start_codon:yes stop_codon:yes gene_type:complete